MYLQITLAFNRNNWEEYFLQNKVFVNFVHFRYVFFFAIHYHVIIDFTIDEDIYFT